MYSLQVKDRNYNSWVFEPNDPFLVNPLEYKLFHNDCFNYSEFSREIDLVYSPIRENVNIPGVLILENNRSYGRTENRKRLLYRCKPFEISYPHFLIPYEIPMGFNKNFRNKYVTFRFDNWDGKHPIGILSQVIGDIDDLPSYYEYQLFCRNLHQPITKPLRQCKLKTKEKTNAQWIDLIMSDHNRFGKIERDENPHIFAIDPEDCTDRDDAISIQQITDQYYIVTVYIANVWVWLEAFDLWPLIGNRISTVYLPDKKRSMLPSVIAEEICSLDANKECFVIAMDFHIQDCVISYDSPRQKLITVNKHFAYEDKKLFKDKGFRMLEGITKSIDKSIQDSHDLVAFWMMQMNTSMAKLMRQKEIGIFRTVQSSTTTNHPNQPNSSTVPKTLRQFVRIWEQKLSGQYIAFHPAMNLSHDVMGVSEYVHFTSPIRRMVDLVNHLSWISSTKRIPEEAYLFSEQFIYDITNKNAIMGNIKKVQNDCNILFVVTSTPELLQKEHDGFVISSLGDNMYSVYFEELKWIAKLHSSDFIPIHTYVKCKLYIFVKEEQLRKKIRVQKC